VGRAAHPFDRSPCARTGGPRSLHGAARLARRCPERRSCPGERLRLHVRPNGVLGAAGTEYFSFVLNPANPAQQCTVSVSFTAPSPQRRGSYTTSTTTAARHRERLVRGRRLPPVLVVGWAAPLRRPGPSGSLTVTAQDSRRPPRSECRRAAATGGDPFVAQASERPTPQHRRHRPDGEQRRLLHDRSGRQHHSAGNARAMAPTRQSPSHRWWAS